MASEIIIPCSFYPANNLAGFFQIVPATQNQFRALGFGMADDVVSGLNFVSDIPVPPEVASTPNGKLWIDWRTTSSDTSSTIDLDWYLKDVAIDTDSLDPGSGDWEDSGALKVSSAGAHLINREVASLSGSELQSGRILIGRITRDAQASNSDDTLAATIHIIGIYIVMDRA